MRKITRFTALLVVLALIGSILIACTQTPTPTTTATTSPTTTATTKPTTTTTTTTTTTATTSPQPTQATTLVLQSFAIPGTYFYDKIVLEEFIQPLEKASGGRIKINHKGSGSVVPDAEIHTAVGKGVIDMGLTLNTYYAATLPIAALEYGYPGQYASDRDTLQFLRQGGEELLRAAYMEKFNVYHLWPEYDHALELMSTKPIPDLASVKGMKIRATGGMGQVLTKAGASVVMMPGTEIFTALQTKVIDAAAYGSMNDAFSIGLQDICKYSAISLYASRLTADTIMNPTKFNALPEDLRTIIQMSAERIGAQGGYYNDWQRGLKVTEFKTKGGTTYDWSAADRAQLTKYSLELMEEVAAKDAKYAAPAVKIFKDIFAQR